VYAHGPFCVQLLDQFLLSPRGRPTIKSRVVVSDQDGHPHAPCSALGSDRGSALCCGLPLPCALPPPAVGLAGTPLALPGPRGPSPGLRLEVLEEYVGFVQQLPSALHDPARSRHDTRTAGTLSPARGKEERKIADICLITFYDFYGGPSGLFVPHERKDPP
jgi:hypothetical protein